MSDKKEFLLDLANVLEKHRVAICSRNTGTFSEVFFQKTESEPFKTINVNTDRLHVTAYDLRCQSGMGSKEANDLYEAYKESKIPKCCVCGTTDNLRKDGWYGYRCDSEDCMCF